MTQKDEQQSTKTASGNYKLAERDAELSSALRDNLMKRKQQARARKASAAPEPNAEADKR